VRDITQDVRSLIDREPWVGTAAQLVASLGQIDGSIGPTAAHIAIWLRRHEPTLWWDHGIRVRFSRTGQQRLVHISLRDPLLARSLTEL
jgi:hypothetical protein